jgi:hypothetical protein
MPSEQIGSAEDQRWSRMQWQYVIGPLFMLLVVLPCLCLSDGVIGWLRAQFASIGLPAEQIDLLDQLDLARHNAMLLIGPEEEMNPYSEWDSYVAAVKRCRQAKIANWRIRLAGGKHVLVNR